MAETTQKNRTGGKAACSWILDRAQQYADVCHVTRDEVLEAWENDRTSWWPNYYKDANQPDLAVKQVVTLAEWEAVGKRLYGEDKRDWKFRYRL
jgi:hypothetical protein